MTPAQYQHRFTGSEPPCARSGPGSLNPPCRSITNGLGAENLFGVASSLPRGQFSPSLTRLGPHELMVTGLITANARSGRTSVRFPSWGTVDTQCGFDRRFNPTSNQVRERWTQLALARRLDVALPPVEVYRVTDRHFMSDGRHRVLRCHGRRASRPCHGSCGTCG
jgi:hypothetical protein